MVLRHLPPKSHTGQEEPTGFALANRRLIFFRAVVVIVLVVFVVRLWRLQVVEGQSYKTQAGLNLLTVIDVEAPRGLIYARGGELLARNAPSYEVSIVPAYLPDDEAEEMAVYQRLSELLDIPASGRVEAAVEDYPELPSQALATVRFLPVMERLAV